MRNGDLPATPLCFLLLVCIDGDWYVPIRTKKCFGYFNLKRKEQPSPGDDANTAEATLGIAKRDGQGEAGRADTTPNGARTFTTRILV